MKPGETMTYQNDNAGHKLRVRLLTIMPGSMWLVELLSDGSRFPMGSRLTVHQRDLNRPEPDGRNR